ncbi:MAG: S8 family serine peptidase [Nitrospirae bacterium]|nr:S8 family serine peptidase [Nitrospirota bacterium]
MTKKSLFPKKSLFLPLLLLFLLFSAANVYSYEDDIGYTALKDRLGSNTPDGTGVPVMQVEALDIYGQYMSDVNLIPDFSGKTFTDKTGLSTDSSHATSVGKNFFGRLTSIAPGITDIWNYEAGDFLFNNLRVDSGLGPVSFGDRKIINNSWIGYSSLPYRNLKSLSRIDDVVEKQNIVVVAGVGNGADSMSGTPNKIPFSAYNVIAVGRSDGISSYGPTSIEGPRAKPDIVAPLGSTSGATPVVGAAAALLLEKGQESDAQAPVVIKSLLMAGAEKLPGWHKGNAGSSDDISVPLDWKQGAGSLRIDRSYDILNAGEQKASDTEDVTPRGWDFGSISGNDINQYFFNVTGTNQAFQAALTWNREITSYGDGTNLDGTRLWNLDLVLRKAPEDGLEDISLASFDSFYYPDDIIQESRSNIDNVEYIYLNNLSSGRYVLEVESMPTPYEGTENYGLSWTVIPEPSTIILLGFGLIGLALLARKESYLLKNEKI